MAELGTIAAVIATIAAAAGCAVAGVALRRRRIAKAAAVDWVIEVGGKRLRVHGPWRNANGVIYAMSPADQLSWAQSIGARLPTAREFDAIWSSADVKVPPHLYPNASGPLDAFDADVRAAGGKAGDKIAGNKTWIHTPAGAYTNYGYFVPTSEVAWNAEIGAMVWTPQGVKAYPTTLPAWHVLQAPGTAHNAAHKDNSQSGWAVEELGPAGES